MSRARIGHVLSRMGKLSGMDIDEILVQQAVTGQLFGEIALSWGLCEAQHLCEAWCTQLTDGKDRVDLDRIGIDAHAAASVPANLARRLCAMPIRSIADQVIVATGHLIDSAGMLELLHAAGKDVRLVVADKEQIREAIDRYYPPEIGELAA